MHTFVPTALVAWTTSISGLAPGSEPVRGTEAEASFTQSGVAAGFGNAVPMGHEWITRLAALELLGGDPVLAPDPIDPRLKWTKGKAKHTELDAPGAKQEVKRITEQRIPDQRYQSTYEPVLCAIVGERWVDIAGFNVTSAHVFDRCDCFDGVAQEPAEIQQDHFMRRYDDAGAEGGVHAAQRSQQRFIEHFVAAALAPKTLMMVWDGGGYSALDEVDRNYFLFGRALHLFQDSFSPEHTVRMADDNFERVCQVKAYLCSAGAEQHSHAAPTTLDYTSGDVIWNVGTGLNLGWQSYRPSFMKAVALVATEASKDAWAAFIRTMGTPMEQRAEVARAEALILVENWLRFDEAEMLAWYRDEHHRDATYVLAEGEKGKGRSVGDCVRVDLSFASGNQAEKVAELEAAQRLCLYNVVAEPGYSDLFDPHVRMPFHWRWRNALKLETPPAGWEPPMRAADTGVRVQIKSVENGRPMSAPDGIADNAWIYCKAGGKALDFIVVGPKSGAYLRLANANLFLSYRSVTGAVKLDSSPTDAAFAFEKVKGGWALRNLKYEEYVWLSGESPYLTGAGKRDQANAQWVVEGLPPSW